MHPLIITYFKRIIRLIFISLIISLLLFLVYFFYTPSINIAEISINNPFYVYVADLPIWLYLIVYFIVISFINLFIFFSFSIYFDFVKTLKENAKNKYDLFFAEKLSNVLLLSKYNDELSLKEYAKELKPYLKNRTQLESFFNAYTKMQELLAINLSPNFLIIVNHLKLNNKLKSFLYNDNLDERIIAMKVLSYLRITGFEKQIISYSKSKNYALRNEAYAALIRLMETDKPLLNLIGEEYNLSMLDINVIVNSVIKNHKMDINYQALLASLKQRKNIIGLILAKHRYKKEYSNLILILNQIGSPDAVLNKLAWDSFLKLVPDNEGVDIIINKFKSESDDIKLLIIKNSYHLNDKRFYDFLHEVIDNESLLIKIEAMKILFNNNINLLAKYNDSSDIETNKALKEVSDIYIN